MNLFNYDNKQFDMLNKQISQQSKTVTMDLTSKKNINEISVLSC